MEGERRGRKNKRRRKWWWLWNRRAEREREREWEEERGRTHTVLLRIQVSEVVKYLILSPAIKIQINRTLLNFNLRLYLKKVSVVIFLSCPLNNKYINLLKV